MAGRHNLENALGVYACARGLGLTADDIRAGFASFEGVKRRQEIRGEPAGVLVIDSGPSRTYGEQLRRAIARITDQPVALVINTHHHPDHFLGNQAFPPETLAALPGTVEGIHSEGGSFNDNMYRLAGDWMAGTEPVAPTRQLKAGPLELGNHRFELIALDGHTGADLAILDRSTGVLFAGDLVFNDRAATTPHIAKYTCQGRSSCSRPREIRSAAWPVLPT